MAMNDSHNPFQAEALPLRKFNIYKELCICGCNQILTVVVVKAGAGDDPITFGFTILDDALDEILAQLIKVSMQ